VAVLIVSYDLKTSGRDYSSLHNAIRSNCKAWWHYLQSTWLVDTNLDVNTFANALLPHITQQDRLLVIEVSGFGQGWLPKEAWQWISNHTSQQ
jgi:hypothetical protein